MPRNKKAKRGATSRTITCVLNEDGGDPFNISITKGITIQMLKNAIHKRHFNKLKRLSSDDLKLHLIVLGNNDGTRRDVEGKRNLPEGNTEMRHEDKLKYYIKDKSLEKLYVFVEFQPPAPPPPHLLNVICWVEGDKTSFPVEIDSNKLIGHLKKLIFVEISILPNTNAKDLILYRANNIPDDEIAMENFAFKDEDKLIGSRKLSSVFEGNPPKEQHIHIAVKQPNFFFSANGDKKSIEWVLENIRYSEPQSLLAGDGQSWDFETTDDLLETLAAETVQHYQYYKTGDKTAIPIYSFVGSVGTGKSRNAQEFHLTCIKSLDTYGELIGDPQLAKETRERLLGAMRFHVTLGNGHGLTKLEAADMDLDRIISARIMQQLLPRTSQSKELRLHEVEKDYDIPEVLEIFQALAARDEKDFIEDWTGVLVVDGLQNLLGPSDDRTVDTAAISTALRQLSTITLSGHFILICCTATLFSPFSTLHKVSRQSVLDLPIADLEGPYLRGTRTPIFNTKDDMLKLLVEDCGGQGRALESLYTCLLKLSRKVAPDIIESLPNARNFDQVMRSLITQLLRKYGPAIVGFKNEDLLPILRATIGNRLLHMKDRIPGTNIVAEDIGQIGLFRLRRSEGRSDGYITAPFIWIAAILEKVQQSNDETVTQSTDPMLGVLQILDYTTIHSIIQKKAPLENQTWKDFESFVQHFRVLKSYLLDEGAVVGAKEFHAGAVFIGTKTFVNRRLDIAKLICQTDTRSSSNNTPMDRHKCYINCDNAPFGDIVVCLDHAIEGPNGANPKIINTFNEVIQCKYHQQKTPLNQKTFNTEKEKAAIDGKDVFILFTTKTLEGISLKPLEGYVDQSCWKSYFGPFAGRSFHLYGQRR